MPIGCGKHVQRIGGGKDHRDFAGEEFARHFEDIGPIKVNVENGRIDAAPTKKADGVKGRGGGADDGGAEVGETAAKIGGEGRVVFNDKDALALEGERRRARVYWVAFDGVLLPFGRNLGVDGARRSNLS